MIEDTVTSATEPTHVQIGAHGRLVIPAPMRSALGIAQGDSLVARVEDGRLILEKEEAILARIHARFGAVPAGVSLADELIRERREEAKREDDE